MEVKSISFTGKTPKISTAQKAFNEAIAKAIGQSDKDYITLSKQAKLKEKLISTDFIEKAKKFFSNALDQ